jgi:hypothetical protein
MTPARRQLAIDLFNHVWTLMGTLDRTRDRRASAGIADPEHREHAMEDIAELL